MSTYNYADAIQHHGIKGQRWGVRRFQNKDGSLTPAGEKRYNTDIEGAKRNLEKAKNNEKKALREYNRATGYGTFIDEKATNKLNESVKKTNWAKQDLSSEKVKEKLNKETGEKSARRQKLEQQYLDKGMTKEEAEIAAYKRERTEKILAVSAGVAITAAATYAAYKVYDKNVDKVLKPGTTLQNISSNSQKGVDDAFYASMTNMDNAKYRGMYGDTISKMGNKVYETKIGVKESGLKIASEKSAVSALSDLVKNDASYAKTLEDHLESSRGRYSLPKQNDTVRKGLKSLREGKVDAKVYNALNVTLVDHALPTSNTVNKGFYDQLKSKGYDAIVDVNDKKLSGYMSSKPVIVFNGSAKTAVDSVREVGGKEMAKAKAKGMADIVVKSNLPTLLGAAGVAGLNTTITNAVENKTNDQIVREYRKKHPDTKLSYTEIVRNHSK